MFRFRNKSSAPVLSGAEWRAKGNDALSRGALAEAAQCYRSAAAADPGDPAARVNLGYVLLDQGQPAAAAAELAQALTLAQSRPELLADAHFLHGRALQAQGFADAAADEYRAALRLRPAFLEALREAVALLAAQGAAAEAVSLAEHAARADPQAGILMLLAQALDAAGRPADALEPLAAVLAAHPQHAGALENTGSLLLELGRPADALSCFERLVAAHGRTPAALSNCSAVLVRLGRAEEALACAEEALRADPRHHSALRNKGFALLELLRLEEAQRFSEAALREHPADPDLRWNAAVAYLLRGDFEPGWKAHEARWEAQDFSSSTHGALSVDAPRWSGREPLEGRSILLYGEQGLGDAIQFLRYVPLVAQRAGQVLLQVQPELVNVLGVLPANCRVLQTGDAFTRPDFTCPLLSLPYAFGTTLQDVPASVPYLRADPARAAIWRSRLPADGRPRVGIAWSGNPRHNNDRNRSIALSALRAIDNDHVQFVAVQPQVRDEDCGVLQSWKGVLDAGPHLHDFAETAALFTQLDLVVTVDTSVAHLAGALGRPVWILLPYVPDWRWMVEREDSPWYPTARLFRQSSRGDWAGVLQRVRAELLALRPGEGR